MFLIQFCFQNRVWREKRAKSAEKRATPTRYLTFSYRPLPGFKTSDALEKRFLLEI